MDGPGAPPAFDDETGAPLNEAARRIVEEAKAGASAAAAAGQSVLEGVPDVEIAPGKWKYVQIKLFSGGESKLVVRNTANLGYHPEMYDHAMHKLRPLGIEGEVIGGGRIRYSVEEKAIDIYGYSKTFGRAPGCNEKSAEICRAAYPDYKVTWSDDGY